MSKTILYRTNDDKSVEALSQYLSFLNEKDKVKSREYILEIKLNRPIRSVSQNRRYRALLKCIAIPSGYTEDQLHEFFKKKLNGIYVLDELIGQTTSNMNVDEFNVYMKKVEEYGKEFFGAVFIDPKESAYAVWEQITNERYDAMFQSI